MGLTRGAQATGGAVNVIITFVVMVPMEIISYLLDQQTLSHTFGEILSGAMVSALAGAITFGIASALALTTLPAVVIVGGTIIVGLLVNVGLQLVKPAVSGLISMELDRAAQRLAEEEVRKARGQRILGQFYQDNPGFRSSPWYGLMGPRW
jgi:hypothetical protein